MESVLCAFDKGFVSLHLLVDSEAEEYDNNGKQCKSANEEACGSNRFCCEMAEVEHKSHDCGCKTAEPKNRYRVFQLDLLEKAD